MGEQSRAGYPLLAPEASFEALLGGERARVVRFCVYMTGNPGVAEDLAQETLLEAWRNWQKFSVQDYAHPENYRKWLLAIARNVCLRWGRRYGRELANLAQFTLSASGEEETSLDDLPADESVEFDLERDELADLLDRALALLPPTTRAVLIERYIHESPHREIAERLGLSEDALVQRLYRGKLALRHVIQTQLSAEASVYGLVAEPDPGKEEAAFLEEETRIWCPMCNKKHLTKSYDQSLQLLRFACPDCWQISSTVIAPEWRSLQSSKALLNRQLAYLGDYYWSAIKAQQAGCLLCGSPLPIHIQQSQDMSGSRRYSGGRGFIQSISVRCDACAYEDINSLAHLAIDVAESQQFWRQHSRMYWLPSREIDYAGQPALLSGFQSAGCAARLDLVFHSETLKLLGIHETTS